VTTLGNRKAMWGFALVLTVVLCATIVAWVATRGESPSERDTPNTSSTTDVPAADNQPSATDLGAVTPSSPAVGRNMDIMVRPEGTTDHEFEVNTPGLDVTIRWAQGGVVLSLTSPSGRVIDRDNLGVDVTHEVGPTFESYHVKSPEQGVWTATLYGAQVAPQGEETRLDIYQAPATDTQPTARIEQSFSGRTVTVDGSTSSDPDGSIVKYLWEFGDGATANGPAATHTYTEPGTYLVTLAVQDDRGRWNVTSAPSKVQVK